MNLRTRYDGLNLKTKEMKAEFVIRLEGVSVCYKIPHERYGTFKEYVIRRLQGRVNHREFWALSDINLEIGTGEILGVVGRNGSGKSTLLKVISRVLSPSEGRVRVRGKIAPLLELGAGFHPELTGRENIYLNGTLLGHPQDEIEDRLEGIIAFSEIESFIDIPIRTYSSGMVARLGFAVATAWEPDILLLDEILTVGDEAFQNKCLAHLENIIQGGTTVLIVSHSASIITNMCQRAAWIDQGNLQSLGTPDEVVKEYHNKYKRQ